MKQVIWPIFLLLFLSACMGGDSEDHSLSGLEIVEDTASPVIDLPPVTAPPVTAPPVTAPPVTAPPVTAPPVTAPPVTAPPVIEPAIVAMPVLIEWLDNSDNEDGFIIERKSAKESRFTTVKYLMADTTDYVDDSLLAGVYYCYKVTAFNQAGSAASDEICIEALYK